MTSQTFDFVKDIILMLIFFIGMGWMWGWYKLGPTTQQNLEHIFKDKKTKFKWLFLIGFVLIAGFFIYKHTFAA